MKIYKVTIAALLCVVMLILAACGSSVPSKQEDSGSSRSTKKEESKEATKTTKAPDAETQTEDQEETETADTGEEPSASESEESTEDTAVSTVDPSAPLIPFKAVVFDSNNLLIEIWEGAAEQLKSQGIDLQVVQKEIGTPLSEFLLNGEADICVGGYLGKNVLNPTEPSTKESKTCPVGYAYGYPAHLYSKTVESLDELKDGAEIYYPAHGCRQALLLLQEAGLITVKKDMPFFRTESEEEADKLAAEYVESYQKNIKLKSYLTSSYGNGISAYLSGLDAFIMEFLDVQRETSTGNFWRVNMIYEDPLVDYDYINTLDVRSEDVKDPAKLDVIEKVVEAYQSDNTRKCYEKTTTNTAPAGWDVDLISQYR